MRNLKLILNEKLRVERSADRLDCGCFAAALPFIAAIGTIATTYSAVENAKATKKTPQTIMQLQPGKETIMPTADDDAMRAAKRKSLLDQLSRGGRESTILSGSSNSSTLG